MAFDTAISGISAATSDLNVIGNNVANSSTTGFKSSRAQFADVFATSVLGVSSNAIGSGVTLSSVNQEFSQGNIQFTNNSLDLAINGDGFFVLSEDGAQSFSRAGSFVVDEQGFIVSSSGAELQAFGADINGNITGQLSSIQLETALIAPNPTSDVDVTLNLDSREAAPLVPFAAPFDAFATPPTSPDTTSFNASSSTTIFDGLGNPHTLDTFFVKSAAPNQWDAYTLVDGVSQGGPTTLTFEDNGQFALASLPAEVPITGWVPLDSSGNPNGAPTQDLAVDLSTSTQFGASFGVSSLSQDGFSAGQLSGISVDETGVVFARFTNGQSQALGQVALAGFNSTNGLQPIGNSSWLETFASGPATISDPGTGGLGVIQAGALEDSNVEITEQLVDMIVAQRNFQAAAQVIQTADTITQTIINIR